MSDQRSPSWKTRPTLHSDRWLSLFRDCILIGKVVKHMPITHEQHRLSDIIKPRPCFGDIIEARRSEDDCNDERTAKEHDQAYVHGWLGPNDVDSNDTDAERVGAVEYETSRWACRWSSRSDAVLNARVHADIGHG